MENIKKYAGVAVLLVALGGIVLLANAAQSRHSSVEPRTQLQASVDIPVSWGDLGAQLVALGVIDKTKFGALYASRPDLANDLQQLAYGTTTGDLVVTPDNAGLVLNLLWAFGLANKNPILEDKTQMMNPSYGGAGGFASTGGWTLAKGDAMSHYDKHALVQLTAPEQATVDRVAANIYRPCCDNPTHFPDCNHGMAMLGLLELMAKAGVSEPDMYRYALRVQALWFPQEYATIERYLETRGSSLAAADPKEILGKQYSSASGYAQIQAQVQPQGGSGAQCSV